ncbi:AAA domain-containing protein [Solirubrobacter ginsenosidimutans]|uniref:AAA domain-containing protein n=1 Tax=Solirubrobacter ginsenosidimutans TaxID=490573 RepID=A0A9X3S106_9ACTN|nr:AAA domain-containing protein [Solirubrobacter ginsenosidimutans]MDA0160592.1 AAA domain-containing protein [Solirubrobacter ginsenosidimutans]
MPAAPESDSSSSRRQVVERAVKAWTDQLVDRSARNNLLFFRDQRTGTLDLGTGATLFDVLAGRSRSLDQLAGDDPEARADAARRARAIHNKAQAIYEERGIHTLHVACGLATWENAHGTAIPAAPVLLAPATLSVRGAAQKRFDLAVTGDLEVNPTLLNALAAEFDCHCDPDELLARAGIDGAIDTPQELETAFAWLREQAASVPGFSIGPKFALGNFSYAKLPMVRDLQSSVDALVAHDLIAALAGDPAAQGAIRARRADIDPSLPDRTPPHDEFLVLDADSSQNHAINKVLAGQDLVIKGPPGTGKSQTIGNLISALVARGKTVLFVAEKRAAIDAVLKRLDKAGLGDLVLDLHGGVSGKRQVAQSLEAALRTNASIPQPNLEREQRLLETRRTALNDWTSALHARREPWDVSLLEAQQQLLALDAQTSVRLRGSVLRALTDEVLEDVRERLRDYIGLGGLRAAAASPWGGAAITTRGQVEQARDLVDLLATGLLDATLDDLEHSCAEVGLPAPTTLRGWGERIALWQAIQRTLERFEPELFEQSLDTLAEQLAPLGRGAGARLSATLGDADFRAARKQIKGLLRDGAGLGKAALLDAVSIGAEAQRQWHSAGADGPPTAPAALERMSQEHAALTERMAELEALLGVAVDGSREGVTERLRALRADAATLGRLPDLHQLRTGLTAAGIDELVRELEHAPVDSDVGVATLDHAVMASIVDEIRLSDLRVGGFDGEQHERTVADFRESDRRHIKGSAQRVRRLAAERATRAEDEHPEQATLIRKEAARKSRHRPVRDNVRDAPDVMTALKPCWVMSPLVVSQVLPNDRPYFDVVIFDEASQVRPAEAVPAIARGRQLVVAGDEKQLPPTDFFSGPTIGALDEDESALSAASGDFESILDTLLFLVDWQMLSWHYRSRDERLIAFSNAHLYGRSLLTFPGISGPECLRHELVEWQPYDHGSDVSAGAEVLRVVELILEHAELRPSESLGVIAMGIAHADRIDAALRDALRDRSDLDDFFDETVPDRFFIKNLERVQGDERDAIILTVGYGKGADGRMIYRFGPLNNEGGERRLNVAISRARSRMTVVSSFTSFDLDPDRTRARGADLLRRYLAFAETNGDRLDREGVIPVELNPFELDVYDALQHAGIPLLCQYGVSEYRLDFAAKHPDQPGRLVLAIEADGASYHSAQTARDRDRLRQEQLERLGWRFHRIWSQDWFTARGHEIERARAAYDAAVSGKDRKEPVSDAERLELTVADAAPAREERPDVFPWGQIDQFTDGDLIAIVRWIESDTLLRTREELLTAAIAELGFKRRGSKIVARVGAAIDASRNGATGTPQSARLDWREVDVVGESHYRDSLRAIVDAYGVARTGRVRVPVRAELVPEPDNPWDAVAVAVHVDGRHVAHLSRAAARTYQPAIVRLNAQGKRLIVDAQLVGYAESNIGVFLRLPEPQQLHRVV